MCRKVCFWQVPRTGSQEVPAPAEAQAAAGTYLHPAPLPQAPTLCCCRALKESLVYITLVSGRGAASGVGVSLHGAVSSQSRGRVELGVAFCQLSRHL